MIQWKLLIKSVIGRTILISFTAIALIPLFLFGSLIYINSSANANDTAEERLLSEVQQLGYHCITHLDIYKNDLSTIMNYPPIRELLADRLANSTLDSYISGLPQQDQINGSLYPTLLKNNGNYSKVLDYFLQIISVRPEIDLIRVFYKDGNVLCGVCQDGEEKIDYKGDKSWFKDIIERNVIADGEYYISPISIARQTNSPAIRYCTTYDVNNTRTGLLIVNFEASVITDEVNSFSIGDAGFGLMIDTNYENAEGNLLGAIFLTNKKQPHLVFNESSAGSIQFNAESFPKDNGLIEFTLDKVEWKAAYYKIKIYERELVVVIALPVNEILASSNEFLMQTIGIMLVLAMLIFGVSILITYSIVSPIHDLTVMANRIGDGDYSARVKTDFNGEISFLGSSFNSMVDLITHKITDLKKSEGKLKEYNEKIEHLNSVLRAVRGVNQLIVKEKDRVRLINGACEELVKTRGYYSCWIVLFDESGNFLTAFEKGIGKYFGLMVKHLRNGELIHCHRLLNESGVIVIQDVLSSCGNCPLKPTHSGSNRSVLAVRLEHGEKIYGMVVVSIPSKLITEKEELLLFQEVADDIAFALNNIKLEEVLKHSEEALRESEERLRSFMESSPDSFALLDSELNYIDVNKAALNVVGETKEEIIGKNILVINPTIKETGMYDQYLDVIKTGKYLSFADIISHPRLENMYYSVRAFKVGNGLGVIATDITRSKRAEEAIIKAKNSLEEEVTARTRDLLEEKQLIETIVETIPDIIFVVDLNGSLVLANKMFKDLYQNIFQEELIPDFNINEVPKNTFFDEIVALLKSNTSESLTIEPLKGLFLQVQSVKIILLDEERFLGHLIEMRDVSPFIKFDNLRKEFISMVSHELRTPITAIRLSVKNLQKYKKKLTEEQQDEIIEMIVISSMNLNQIVEDLLIISRIEAGRLKIQWTSFKLRSVLEALVTQFKLLLQAKSISVQLDVKPDIELLGDPKRISQIFQILLDNAIKYANERTIIKIYTFDNYQGKYNPEGIDGILISVSDSGIGIKEEDFPRIFSRFFRADEVKNIQGTGLGLAIAKELTFLHNGDIYFESRYRKGTTFSVFLPYKGATL